MKQAKLVVLMIAACCITIPLALVVSTLTLKAADPPGHDLTLDDVGGDIPLYGPSGGEKFIRAWCGCLSHAIAIYTDGGSPDPITGNDDVSATVTYTTPGIKTISVYSPDPHDNVVNSPDSFGIYDVGEVTLSAQNIDSDRVSIYQAGIEFLATVTCQQVRVSGKTVTFTSNDVTFPGGSTEVTDSNGGALVIGEAGSWPSMVEYGTWVTATVDNGLGVDVTADCYLTVIEIDNPTPANPKILVGHYPDNFLYSVVLTFTTSPPVWGLPVTFEFESSEGDGVNYAATLEDADGGTDTNGEATVRVRSSDLEETATVLCTFEASCGSTDVTFEGITGVSTVE